MNLLAYDKQDGVGYFQTLENQLRIISFPYTPDSIRGATKFEMQTAINFYGFEKIDKSFEEIRDLIAYLKEAKSYYFGNEMRHLIEGIDVNEIIKFADEKMLMILCDRLESVISTHDIVDLKTTLQLVKTNAIEKDFESIIDRSSKLLMRTIRLETFQNATLLNTESIVELKKDLNKLWENNDIYSNLEIVYQTPYWMNVIDLLSVQILGKNKSRYLPQWLFELFGRYESRYNRNYFECCLSFDLIVDLQEGHLTICDQNYKIEINDKETISNYYKESVYKEEIFS